MGYEEAMDYLKDQADRLDDEWEAVESLTAERDQLRAELIKVLRFVGGQATGDVSTAFLLNVSEEVSAVLAETAGVTADLRAEVERLRGQSKAALLNAKQSQDGWSEALKLRDSARARAEAAERERDEAQAQTRHWREAAVKENERAIRFFLNAAAEAQAHAADEAAPEVKP